MLDLEPTAWQRLTTQEKAREVRRCVVDEGLSYTQTGMALGASRVSIAGVAHRNKIQSPFSRGPMPTGAAGGNAMHQRKMLRDIADGTAIAKHARPGKRPTEPPRYKQFQTDDVRPPVEKAWQALPDTAPRPLDQHGEHQCRWPVDVDAMTLFCCAPTKEASRYCTTHHAMSYRPAPPLKLNGKKT